MKSDPGAGSAFPNMMLSLGGGQNIERHTNDTSWPTTLLVVQSTKKEKPTKGDPDQELQFQVTATGN